MSLTRCKEVANETRALELLFSRSVVSNSFATPWTVAHEAPLSMGFSRQEYWSGLPFLPPGDLPDPGIESMSPALQVNSLPVEPPGKPPCNFHIYLILKNLMNIWGDQFSCLLLKPAFTVGLNWAFR